MNTNEEDFPTRSADGLAALDVFYEEFNDINFYVEDSEQENLYEVIFRRLFPSVRIDRIFPLGGKEAVLRHAGSAGNISLPAFRAYILDRDFDSFLGGLSTLSNVFYLGRFCIENHLLEEQALVEIAVETHPKIPRSKIAATLDIGTHILQSFCALRPLFICFACVQRFKLGLQNCGSPPEVYCLSKRRWEVDPAALARYVEAMISAGNLLSPPLLDPLTDARMADVSSATDHELVSGKHVATMLFHYIKSKYSLGSITFHSFIYRLAKNCSLTSLGDLGPRIVAEANVFNAARSRASLTF
jgi:Protein of unknown function (DUF4435)